MRMFGASRREPQASGLCSPELRVLSCVRRAKPPSGKELREGVLRTTVCAMLEYELYLPLHYNDGRPIDPEKLKNLKKRLVDEFGGLTHFRQENEGLWKIGEHTFRDRIEIVRVLASDETAARKYFTQLKADLTKEWGQQDFLIVSRQVAAV